MVRPTLPGVLRLPTSYTETVWTSHMGCACTRVYEGRTLLKTVLSAWLTRNSRDFEDLAPRRPLSGHRSRRAWPRPVSADPIRKTINRPFTADILGLLDVRAALSIIGTSMGGLLAMMMGVGHRARVAAMVLNDMGPKSTREDWSASRLCRPPAAAEDWDDAIAQTHSMFGAAWPNLSADRWATLTRRAIRD